jgi:hypothetical protein
MLLYYCGHGHEDYGGWVMGFKPGVISRHKHLKITDILDAVRDYALEDKVSVEITSESCYSGK